MTEATRMRKITTAVMKVLRSRRRAMSFDELQKCVTVVDVPITGMDIREAAWRLVDSQVAEFTPEQSIKLVAEKYTELMELSATIKKRQLAKA